MKYFGHSLSFRKSENDSIVTKTVKRDCINSLYEKRLKLFGLLTEN